jgi:hypothetical protein
VDDLANLRVYLLHGTRGACYNTEVIALVRAWMVATESRYSAELLYEVGYAEIQSSERKLAEAAGAA